MKQLNMKHTPHDTRHTCISLLTKADVNPTTIKKIVGHKGAMSLTKKVYTHMDYQTLLDAEYSTHSEPHRPALRATRSIM